MGIFAVAQILNLHPLAREHGRELLGLRFRIEAREVVRDHAVVAGGMRKHLLRERKARGGGNFALNLDFVENQLIVGRINDHSNRLAVLRRRADHRRAADVDILNRFLERAVRTRHGLLEGIEIHADDVDRINAVLLERRHVLGHRTTGEDARMDLGVERLHAAVEHFGESRVVGHFLNVNPFAGEKLRSAAGRKDVVSRLDEAAGELDDARLIRNGEECLLAHVYFSLNFLEVPRAGSIPCSWSFLRKVFRLMPSNWAAAH